MKFLVVLLLEVDIIHLVADGAFLDVSSTVAKVGGHFAFGVLLQAIVTPLHFYF